MTRRPMTRCGVYWGSHGCDKPDRHWETGDIVHRCGQRLVCSETIVLGPENDDGPRNAATRYAFQGTPVEWSEWLPGRWFT